MSDLRLPDLNKVYLVGRLTRDPELRYLNSGTAVCKIGLAVSRFYKSREGERREETTFVNVDVWDKTAEYVGNNLRKGRPVLVEGRLKSDSWEDRNTGEKRTSIGVRAERVQQLDWDDRGGGGGGGSRDSYSGGRDSYHDTPREEPGRPKPRAIEEPIPEDDIPF